MVDGRRIAWPKYVVDHIPGAVTSIIARLRMHGIEGPWIVMATLTRAEGYQIVLGDGYPVGPVWQDLAYLGEVV